ncbi:nucleotide disphospho-sugar-binding domain-containing protein [Streptomyces collinus]|uniref:glycosyltransferase n=1 Tax=Streptomyces collinus TaxID=42684 RepID=UPI0036E1ED81
MRFVLSTYGSRGDVEPLVALAVRLRERGAEVRVCAPPDEHFAQRLAGFGVPLVGVGPSARALTKAAPPPSSLPERDLPDGRDDCLLLGEVNHQALFGRVAGVLHHGGAGTTTTAARAGAPQVVLPQAADQPYWAGRVAGLGIGAAHDGPAPTSASLSAALGTALSPATGARARSVATTVRTDGASVAARLLLTETGRSTPHTPA